MRTFIALPAASLAGALSPALEAHAALPLRWVPAENWHVTLRFLGETEPSQLTPLAALLQRVAVGSPFALRLDALRWFPSERRRVALVASVAGNARLIEMQGILERGAVDLGFAPETRGFHPHLTLARPERHRRAPPFAEIPLELALKVSEVALYESVSSAKGVRYRPLARAEIAGTSPSSNGAANS